MAIALREPDNPSKEQAWAYLSASSLILLAPLIVFIDFYGYPFTNPETLCVLFVMLIFGLAWGQILRKVGAVPRVLILTCLLEFSLDLIGSFEMKGKIICAILAFLFTWFLREKAPKIISFAFSIFIVVTVAFPSDHLSAKLIESDQIAGSKVLPPVIHLVLDGHIGIEGIPNNIWPGRKLKKDLILFYAGNDFHLYGYAYSHFDKTLNSVSGLLNFYEGVGVERGFVKKTESKYFGKEMIQNKYFKKMSNLGYKIKVYQPVALNYCRDNFRIASCYTYQTFSLKFLEELSSTVSSKAWVLLSSYFPRSEFFRTAKNGYWYLTNFVRQLTGIELPFPWSWNGRQTSPIDSFQALEKLSSDIQKSSEGTLFFAHLLIPHAPFIYDSNCQIYKNPTIEWLESGNPALFSIENSTSSRTKRYKRYIQQINCVNKQLQSLFSAMRSSKVYKNTTIIIHGDHGSRIRIRRPIAETRNDITVEDLLDSYSALFAVKTSENESGYDPRVLSLNQAFSMVTDRIFNEEITLDLETPYVYLKNENPDENMKGSFYKWPFLISQ